MAINVLTDQKIKAAKAHGGNSPKLFDGGGLYVHIKPSGAKLWRLKYRFGGAEKLLALGAYPEVTLKRAREKREEARRLIDRQIDPSAQRKASKQAEKVARHNTFAAVAEEWFAHYVEQRRLANRPLAQATVEKLQWLLNLSEYRAKAATAEGPHPLRSVSDRAIASVTKSDVATVIHGLKRRDKIETAHRMLNSLVRVFRYALGTGRIGHNPADAFANSADPRDKLPPVTERHHAAITEPREVGALLRAIDGYSGQPTTQAAFKLSPYLFVRPGELRNARWDEFDIDGDEPAWRIPAPATKMRVEHIVPLPTQAVSILRELFALTGPEGYVFPSLTDRKRPLSENTITAALRRMGYDGSQMTSHGFRTMASTLLREQGWDGELIERQLSHDVGTDVQRAYDKATLMPQRRKMMQAWADYLDGLKSGANVVPISRAKRTHR